MKMADYIAHKAVSASVLRTLIERCPAAAWFESPWNPDRPADHSDASDAGTIAHSILLEGSRDCVEIIDPFDHPAKTTGAIPEGWTNASIRAARDAARAAGKIPVLPTDMVAIDAMVASARRFIDSLRVPQPAVWQMFQPGGGESEVTILWDENGTPCKARPDRIATARDLMGDLKFTKRSAEPSGWGRSMLYGEGYYLSPPWYRRGVKRAFGVENADYIYIVCEQDPPYLCSAVGLPPEGWALGEPQVSAALSQWQRCFAADDWPAYPPTVCYPDPPAYKAAQWEDRQLSGDWRLLFPDLAEKVRTYERT